MATQNVAVRPSGATIQRVNSSKWQVLYEFDTEEVRRLREDEKRQKNWKRWGPYLSERQWGTVREDYSPDGSWYEAFLFANCLKFDCMLRYVKVTE